MRDWSLATWTNVGLAVYFLIATVTLSILIWKAGERERRRITRELEEEMQRLRTEPRCQ